MEHGLIVFTCHVYKLIIFQNSYSFCIYGQIPEGNGSGVVWDGKGHIVTNYHGKMQTFFRIFCSH